MMSDKNPIESLLDVLGSFRKKILTIRKMVEVPDGFNQKEANLLLNEGIFDLIEIKKLNEIVQINCEDKKDKCDEIKDEIGKDNLDQKKYEYHLDLIKNDIYTNKQLPKLPESNKVILDEGNNKDEIKIEVFENILLGRKRLNKELNDLKEEKKKNDEILKNKLNYKKELPKHIELLEKEINKTKRIFNDSKI